MTLSPQLFHLVFNALPVACLVADSHFHVVACNDAFCQLSGHQLERLLDASLAEFCLMPHTDTGVTLEHFTEGHVDVLNSSGKKVPCQLVIARFEEKGAIFYACRLHLLAKDREMEDRLLHGRKLESLGSLASGIAHDLNNILTGILGHVSFLRLSLPETGSHVESLHAIEDGTRRAATMTQQVLGFARQEAETNRPVNMSLVVAAGVNLLRGALPKNIQLSLVEDSSDLFVTGDEGRLTQLFMNLAVNARDALPSGGKIEVRLERNVIDSGSGKPAVDPGEYVRLAITDNGMGMLPEVKARIFEPFFTTKSSRGTGIGLATVAAIVSHHGGVVCVDSEVGRGTCFEVFLPLCSKEAEIAPAAPEPTRAELPGGSERILVVDDEEVVRMVIQRSLEHLGYRVDVAVDGADALSRFRHEPGRYKLVILDMMMPKMAGDEVFARLKEMNPGIRVLLASGYTSEGRAQAVLRNGGSGFIQKPFAVEDLAREVRRCLDQQ